MAISLGHKAQYVGPNLGLTTDLLELNRPNIHLIFKDPNQLKPNMGPMEPQFTPNILASGMDGTQLRAPANKPHDLASFRTTNFSLSDWLSNAGMSSHQFLLCVGNAWGEAALLLAAGARGNRSALPSSTIMMKQPIARFQGQATDIDLARKEVKNVKAELVKLYAKHIGKTPEEIEADIRRPKYFSPSEAVEYGIIDKVLYNERSSEDHGVVSDLKKAQLI
ncbi:hypothetical protein ACJRO7_019426 [Eucalyptus globulus]|uniref:ATP-dependent Clp protease proteolytic subunit n=1 Tax=Eucalyptus globulus TaxID=34317 RepID=A0ABD3KF06_EUCGL